MTITLEQGVALWARREAARRDTTVSKLIDELLYQEAMRQHFAIVKPVKLREPGERFPTRDELYDRPKRWS